MTSVHDNVMTAERLGRAVPATVVDVLPNAQYLVVVDGEGAGVADVPGTAVQREVVVHFAGAMRVRAVRLVAGDRVVIEISPFDPTKGRIVGLGARRAGHKS
jgi:translation initiation factor IF-1